LLSLFVPDKKRYMLKRIVCSIVLALLPAILPQLSIGVPVALANSNAEVTIKRQDTSVVDARFLRIRHGINLSHWFSQSPGSDYSKTHLDTHTTADDIALIKEIGFDHVRLPIEPGPLFNESDPAILNAVYLRYLDSALDMILATNLAVIVDIHPDNDFKLKLNKDDRQVDAFAKFWGSLAGHLASRNPDQLFLEVVNEPMVEDGYRWFGIQARLISAIRASAPRHTIIAGGHRWSGLPEMLFLQPYADSNVIYNFHFYEPFAFTHQGATWAGPHLPFYKNVPYPSTPEALMRVMASIQDDAARYNLLRYGEDGWNASRIDKEIAVAAAWAAKHRVHVTCNEFGTFRKFASPVDRAAWLQDMRTALEKHGIGWTMWDYSGGFAVVNKANGRATGDPEILKALGLSR
jgi:endoglucanase